MADDRPNYLDAVDEIIWQQVQRGDIVEIEARIQRLGIEKVVSVVEQFLAMSESFQGTNMSVTPEIGQIVEMIRATRRSSARSNGF